MELNSQPLPIVRACAALGGQAELARVLGVSAAAVNQWCHGVRKVPASRCPAIERETLLRGKVVRCEELRPDVEWHILRLQSGAAQPQQTAT